MTSIAALHARPVADGVEFVPPVKVTVLFQTVVPLVPSRLARLQMMLSTLACVRASPLNDTVVLRYFIVPIVPKVTLDS